MKFLVDDGRFDYIESGSLLGVLYRDVSSLPVGYEQQLRMYPLSLLEFFEALGVQEETVGLVGECFSARKPVPEAVHERLVRLTRLYFAVGGMPDAVARFVETSDLAQVMDVGEWGLREGLVFCRGNVERQGRVSYLPWYMLSFLKPAERGELVIDDWRSH